MAYHLSQAITRPLRSRRHSPDLSSSPESSSSAGSATPPTDPAISPTSSSFLTSSVSSLWGGFMRRFSSEPSSASLTPTPHGQPHHAYTFQPDGSNKRKHLDSDTFSYPRSSTMRDHGRRRDRSESPMRPPPLEPVQLVGFADDTRPEARLLTQALAEEIRIMVPARLGIVDEWRLVYSLEQDGASLATLYDKCARYQGVRVGFVLCVKDLEGGLFGAYLSDRPRPAPKYFGTGECFLWRASVIPGSATTTTTTTTTTANGTANGTTQQRSSTPSNNHQQPQPQQQQPLSEKPQDQPHQQHSPSIRFKAYPYSGINEYYMLCEAHFLSLGAGDGKFGLWLDDGLERGVSATSQTFGNEPLSEEGEKFGVLGVEVWVIGA
ncbi:hypothetical protein VTJ49DRAFT_4968 [Mycothermus thermophilus]|uniref:Oxidation resistance protein 1 n=1 Tax=Humicola insolens TaxID=85995 RepID=A0ABR3VQL3_HUMIN